MSTKQLDRYTIIEQLGQGAMGTVYRARDPQIDRTGEGVNHHYLA